MTTNKNVAVIIPAKNEAKRITSTVQAAYKIPQVNTVLVVDDGSTDNTYHIAQGAGAQVVRHQKNKGKATAMTSGVDALTTADEITTFLFLDADLGETALACAGLVPPVLNQQVDCTIAYLPPQNGAGGHGFVTGAGYKAIKKLTGWEAQQPLSGQRCISRTAFNSVRPLAKGWGVEVGMTIDLLVNGFTVQEVPCNLQHRATANDFSGYLHRAGQYRDVQLAVLNRLWKKVHVPKKVRTTNQSELGKAFNAYQK